ncbi:MAG: HAD-IA family hydrolase [Rhodospirillales bacterium]|nr:HAD-IA family hydrolase [Rhodospirillales bacterium]
MHHRVSRWISERNCVLSPVSRTLVLDLDGTIVDSVPDLAAALNRLMATRGLAAFTEAETMAMVGDGVARLLERAFAARDRAADAGALADYAADYGAHYAVASRLYPGVAETLAALAADRWRLAVCTNKPEAPARALLDALGIGGRFAAVCGGDSFPTRKPDPAHLLGTLQRAGGTPDLAVMAGDHGNDMAAARGAGVPGIFASWGYGPPAAGAAASAIARRFTDLPALASGLLGPCRPTR